MSIGFDEFRLKIGYNLKIFHAFTTCLLQLSAESGLFCQIVTEVIFGIRPTGLRSFTLTPRLPQSLPAMSLKNINAFGSGFNISVKWEKDKNHVVIIDSEKKVMLDKTVKKGTSLEVKLHNENA